MKILNLIETISGKAAKGFDFFIEKLLKQAFKPLLFLFLWAFYPIVLVSLECQISLFPGHTNYYYIHPHYMGIYAFLILPIISVLFLRSRNFLAARAGRFGKILNILCIACVPAFLLLAAGLWITANADLPAPEDYRGAVYIIACCTFLFTWIFAVLWGMATYLNLYGRHSLWMSFIFAGMQYTLKSVYDLMFNIDLNIINDILIGHLKELLVFFAAALVIFVITMISGQNKLKPTEI